MAPAFLCPLCWPNLKKNAGVTAKRNRISRAIGPLTGGVYGVTRGGSRVEAALRRAANGIVLLIHIGFWAQIPTLADYLIKL